MKQKARRVEPLKNLVRFLVLVNTNLKMFYAVLAAWQHGRINILSVRYLPVSQNKAKMFSKVYALPLWNDPKFQF